MREEKTSMIIMGLIIGGIFLWGFIVIGKAEEVGGKFKMKDELRSTSQDKKLKVKDKLMSTLISAEEEVEEEEGVAAFRQVQGELTSITPRFINVTFQRQKRGRKETAYEMGFRIHGGMQVIHKQNLGDFRVGDTVRVQYKEIAKPGKGRKRLVRKATSIEFVSSAAKPQPGVGAYGEEEPMPADVRGLFSLLGASEKEAMPLYRAFRDRGKVADLKDKLRTEIRRKRQLERQGVTYRKPRGLYELFHPRYNQ